MTTRPRLRKKKAAKPKRKMRPGGGKQKGNAFERQVCKDLSLWISNGKRDDLLWRSAISGGRATVRMKKGKNTAHQAGDICSVHPDGHKLTDKFFIECKAYRDLKAAALLFAGEGTIAKFWKICKEQAAQHGKLPMLILRQNQQPVVVVLTALGHGHIPQRKMCSFPRLDLHLLSFAVMVKGKLYE